MVCALLVFLSNCFLLKYVRYKMSCPKHKIHIEKDNTLSKPPKIYKQTTQTLQLPSPEANKPCQCEMRSFTI